MPEGSDKMMGQQVIAQIDTSSAPVPSLPKPVAEEGTKAEEKKPAPAGSMMPDWMKKKNAGDKVSLTSLPYK